jgi:hypothetical protein
MEIPLALRERRDGALVASVPIAYRIAAASALVALSCALLPGPAPPGALGWIVLGLVALATLYEERWVFDPSSGRVSHRVGLLVLARKRSIALGDLARVRVAPFVRGTVPGSADESSENAAALSGARIDDSGRKRALFKRHYLCILLETDDGSLYFVDAGSARKGDDIRARAARIAAACGVSLEEG